MMALFFYFKDLAMLMSAFIGFLIGLFFLRSNSKNPAASRLLGVFLLVQSSALFLNVHLYRPPFSDNFDASIRLYLLWTEGLLIMLEGFLLYWYTKTLLFKEFSWSNEIYLHAALLLVMIVFGSRPLNHQDVATLLDLSVVTGNEARIIAVHAVTQLIRCGYACLCFINITRYRRLLEDKYSNIQQHDLSWLNLLIGSYLVVRAGWSLVPVSLVLLYVTGQDVARAAMVIPFYGFVFDTIWMIAMLATLYFALQYSPRFEGLKEKADFSAAEKNSVKPEHASRVEEYMIRHKPYLAVDLKLDELAEKLSLPSKTLSILLNVRYKKNFCEFINQYRIKDAASILSNPMLKEKSVLDIAMEVGFNSKSAFNRSFKRETGATPLKYRRSALGAPLSS
jgi:AraC-like DNA-binding protein